MAQIFTELINNKILYHCIVILGAGLAAFIPRYLPIRLFTRKKVPKWFDEWIKYVPVSLFAALVVQRLFFDSNKLIRSNVSILGHSFSIYGHLDQLLASILVMIIAYFTRSMVLSVVLGLLTIFSITMIV